MIIRARKGERKAVEALLREWQPRIYNFALKHLGNPDDASDVTQQVLFTVSRKISGLREVGAFSVWVFSITMNEIRKVWEERRREIPLQVPSSAGEREGLAFAALHLLPPHQREIILLKEVEGFSIKEIARILSIPEGTVKSRLFYALKALREQYLKLKEEAYGRPQ